MPTHGYASHICVPWSSCPRRKTKPTLAPHSQKLPCSTPRRLLLTTGHQASLHSFYKFDLKFQTLSLLHIPVIIQLSQAEGHGYICTYCLFFVGGMNNTPRIRVNSSAYVMLMISRVQLLSDLVEIKDSIGSFRGVSSTPPEKWLTPLLNPVVTCRKSYFHILRMLFFIIINKYM